jgi:hypothetical protein
LENLGFFRITFEKVSKFLKLGDIFDIFSRKFKTNPKSKWILSLSNPKYSENLYSSSLAEIPKFQA